MFLDHAASPSDLAYTWAPFFEADDAADGRAYQELMTTEVGMLDLLDCLVSEVPDLAEVEALAGRAGCLDLDGVIDPAACVRLTLREVKGEILRGDELAMWQSLDCTAHTMAPDRAEENRRMEAEQAE